MIKPLLLISFMMMSMSVWAETTPEVTFIKRSWDGEKVVNKDTTIADYIEVPIGDHEDDWYGLGANDDKDHYYVVKGDANYETLNVFGRVHLILCNNITLTCEEGILVEPHDGVVPELTIYSQISSDTEETKMGSLIVTNSNKNWAAIGSSKAHDSGKITIHGGNIKATGANYGAGIGAGACTSDVATKVGDITIYGGNVTAEGGDSGAGIGGGGSYDTDQYSDGGNFTMYGGVVKTIGGDNAAGLGGGGGYNWHHDYFCPGGNGGKVYIYGGTLKAYGGGYAAGIGSGTSGSEAFRSNDAGEVNIYGGSVKAYGGYDGAGVGGGQNTNGAKVYVSGGELCAIGGANAAGIGSGYDRHSNTGAEIVDGIFVGLSGGTLNVSGGKVEAEGLRGSAGIGGSYRAAGAFVTITGGIVEAYTSRYDINWEYISGGATAFGAGQQKADYVIYQNHTDRSLLHGSLSIPDNFMVTAGDQKNQMDGVLPLPGANRLSACFEKQYARIEVCLHTEPSENHPSGVITYTIQDGTHTSHCRFCNYSVTEAHNFVNNVCSVCGKTFNAADDIANIYLYTSTNDCKYTSRPQNDKVIKTGSYVLPKPADIEGLIFMGYLEATTAPETIEMLDDDFINLLDAGQTVTPTTDVSYYARYRYDYNEKWTWDENYKPVSAIITWIKSDETLELPKDKIIITDISQDPTDDSDGYYRYIANFTYTKSEGITYNFSDIINLTRLYNLSLADASDNVEILADNEGSKVNTLTLSDRTLYKDGDWNTLCLPFSLSSLTGTPLEGADVRTLVSSSFDSTTGELTLNFSTSSLKAIEAGVPYLVKWAKTDNISNPTFNNVDLSVSDAGFVESDYVGFKGSFAPLSLEANDKTLLYLGEDDTLYYPGTDMTIGAFRAVFVLKNLTAGGISKNIRAFVLNFDDDTNGISTIHSVSESSPTWFSIDGRRLNEMPSEKGMYIHNGRKVMIK